MDSIQAIIRDFGKEIGIEDLSLDEQGYCCLAFDDVVLNMETDGSGESLFLYANVGDLPDEERERFYEMLLEANYFFHGTEGATLGIDAKEGVVLLIVQVPVEALDLPRFSRLVENFVNVAHLWSQRIAEFPAASPPPEDEPHPLGALKV